MTDNDIIDAAEKLAENYNDDDRQDIKTDVMNAFYSGVEFARSRLAATAPEAVPEQGDPMIITRYSDKEVVLETALGDIRDLFPMPEEGEDFRDLWGDAMIQPECVLPYVKAQIARNNDTKNEDAFVINRMSTYLAEIAVALKGRPEPRKRHGYQDLPELARAKVFEAEILKQQLTKAAGKDGEQGKWVCNYETTAAGDSGGCEWVPDRLATVSSEDK